MAVRKYKPSRTPYSLAAKVSEIAARVEKDLKRARENVRQTKRLIDDSRQTLEGPNKLFASKTSKNCLNQ